MKELNIKNINLFAETLKDEYLKKVQSGLISYKKYNAFLNEFQLKNALANINYTITCYNDAEGQYNQHNMNLFKNKLLSQLKALKAKVQKWN